MDNEERKNLKDTKDSNDEEDENDKKPPAKEVVVAIPTPTTVRSPESSSPSSSGEMSVASTSTAMTPSLSSRPSLVLATPGTKTPVVRKRAAAVSDKDNNISNPLLFFNLQDEIYYLSGTALIAFFVFIYVVLPVTALMALAVFFSSLSLLLYTLYTHSRAEFEALLQGRGLGDYLPESLYRTLTQQTLHEYMTDPTFGLENRHLLLYFLPLSNEQRDAFIARLAPHHRSALQRPGLGHYFLGDGFMRLVMGQERWQAAVMNAAAAAAADTSPPPARPPLRQITSRTDASPVTATSATTEGETPPEARLLFDDDDDGSRSDLGLEVDGTDLAGGLSDEAATGLARTLGLANRTSSAAVTDETVVVVVPSANLQDTDVTAAEQEERALQEHYDEELNVLIEAFFNAVNDTIVTPVYDYVADTVSEMVRPATNSIVRYGFGLSLFTGGLGILGYWRGVFGMNRSTSHRTMWMSAAVGGTTIGVALFAHSMLRPTTTDTTTTTNTTPTSETKKQEKSTQANKPDQSKK